MPVYFLDANGVERIKKTCGKVLDDPVRVQPDQQLPYFSHEQVHHAVYVTSGPATNGRYPAKLQYRAERGTDSTTPVWVDFDPSVTCWAIGFEGEALKPDARYHGFLVDEYADASNDGALVFACTSSLSVRPVMVYDGVPVDGRYLGWIEYRDESTPAWLPVDPVQYVWVIGYNGEALEAGKRYKGLFVSTDPVNGMPVYAVQPGGGGASAALDFCSLAHLGNQITLEGQGLAVLADFDTLLGQRGAAYNAGTKEIGIARNGLYLVWFQGGFATGDEITPWRKEVRVVVQHLTTGASQSFGAVVRKENLEFIGGTFSGAKELVLGTGDRLRVQVVNDLNTYIQFAVVGFGARMVEPLS